MYKPGAVTKKWGLKRGESGTTSLGGIDTKIDEIEEEEYFGNQDSAGPASRASRQREGTILKKRESNQRLNSGGGGSNLRSLQSSKIRGESPMNVGFKGSMRSPVRPSLGGGSST